MGKGDQRTKRGKIYRGTHGKHWPHQRRHEPATAKKKTKETSNKVKE